MSVNRYKPHLFVIPEDEGLVEQLSTLLRRKPMGGDHEPFLTEPSHVQHGENDVSNHELVAL